MKVMLNGTETNLRGAINQTWTATKIYWWLRMNSHLMIKAHVAILKVLNSHYQVILDMYEKENLENPVLNYWKKTCHNYFQLHNSEFGLLQDLDNTCKKRMEVEEWQKLKKP